jgi:hypothetical protein
MKRTKVLIFLGLFLLFLFGVINYYHGGVTVRILQRWTFVGIVAVCVGCILHSLVKDVLMQNKTKKR